MVGRLVVEVYSVEEAAEVERLLFSKGFKLSECPVRVCGPSGNGTAMCGKANLYWHR